MTDGAAYNGDEASGSLQDVTVERPFAGAAVVAFRGEHDLADREQVEALLASILEEGHVVVDFSEAAFVDSTIPHVLLNADAAARERGRELRLQLGTEAIVRKAFELSGVLEQLPTFGSREEALDGLGQDV